MPRSRTRLSGGAALALVVVLVLALWWVGRSGGEDASGGAGATSTSSSTASTASRTSASAPTSASGLDTVAVADLPREARTTLALIEAGGPFPYERDGVVFQNREGILPAQPRGWYHEYTVRTPGEDDRGARRIVTGRDGTAYWSADHYASFAVIEEDP